MPLGDCPISLVALRLQVSWTSAKLRFLRNVRQYLHLFRWCHSIIHGHSILGTARMRSLARKAVICSQHDEIFFHTDFQLDAHRSEETTRPPLTALQCRSSIWLSCRGRVAKGLQFPQAFLIQRILLLFAFQALVSLTQASKPLLEHILFLTGGPMLR